MIDLITNNWEWLAGTVALVLVLAERIVRLTPTQTDDKVLNVVRKFFAVVGLLPKDNPGKVDQ